MEDMDQFSFFKITEFGQKLIKDIIKSYNEYFGDVAKSESLPYTDKVPELLTNALKILGNSECFSLSVMLMESGDLTLPEILDKSEDNRGCVTAKVKKLELAGIVQNYLSKKKE